jgi:type IV pilus assembly protein PilW
VGGLRRLYVLARGVRIQTFRNVDVAGSRLVGQCRGVSRRRADGGYSLVDMLVALAVGGGLLAATVTLLHLGLRAWVWGAARVEAQQSARYALERMASEVREAGYDPTVAGIAAVVAAEPARVAIQRDANGNGVIDPTRERVTYVLRAGESILRRDAGGGAQPVINGVRALRLGYLDRDGAATTDPAAVVAVRVQLEVGNDGAAVLMETQATLRNRLW